jgi:predicted nucleotidyltransferase component of viral defense system
VSSEKLFALKGGTAINCFVRDLPRLSVDIDITYLPIEERNESLSKITDSLINISKKIKKIFPNTVIIYKKLKDSDFYRSMNVNVDGILIKIEPNLIIRGSVFDPIEKTLKKSAEDFFEISVSSKVLSFHDLYGGKICATLDRQHPRDLFDIKLLLENEGVSEKTRKAFLVYLAQTNRPMVELLKPNIVDIKNVFENEFTGMSRIEVSLKELKEVQTSLPKLIFNSFTDNEKKFIVSVKELNPNWSFLGLSDFSNLPGIKWKLYNLKNMDKNKYKKTLNKLKSYLEI